MKHPIYHPVSSWYLGWIIDIGFTGDVVCSSCVVCNHCTALLNTSQSHKFLLWFFTHLPPTSGFINSRDSFLMKYGPELPFIFGNILNSLSKWSIKHLQLFCHCTDRGIYSFAVTWDSMEWKISSENCSCYKILSVNRKSPFRFHWPISPHPVTEINMAKWYILKGRRGTRGWASHVSSPAWCS